MELSGSDKVPNQVISGEGGIERPKIEQAEAANVIVPLEQVSTRFARLEEVTSPRKTKDGSLSGKKKN